MRRGFAGQSDVRAAWRAYASVAVWEWQMTIASSHRASPSPPHRTLYRVEAVERRRAFRVEHRDESLGPVATRRTRQHAARLVGMVAAGMRHDVVVEPLADPEHAPRVRRQSPVSAPTNISCSQDNQS